MLHAILRSLVLLLLTIGSLNDPMAAAGEPLHQRIDRLIESKASDVAMQPRSDDAEFVRRVYLDLGGRIPTVREAADFLADKAGDKRTSLIDALLASPDYPRRMQELFNVMLMERRGDNDDWTKFLRAAFETNRPWDGIARDLVKTDADDESRRGAAFFLTQRLTKEGAMAAVDVPGLTRDVGRLLAGVDLQCAQCHDHVDVEHYKQRDFQGLHVIFENIQQRNDVPFPAVAEKLMTEKKDFMSVFTQEPMQTGPVIPGGGEVEILTFGKGEEFLVPPDRKKRTPGVPKFSPLNELAAGLASADNELFCRNIANRLWFVMMGRGLVEPLDLQHTDNPASHPELLQLLAREFAGQDFDIKWLLRELALTDTYQRTSVVISAENAPAASYVTACEKRVSAEQLLWSTIIATGELDHLREEDRRAGEAADSAEPAEEPQPQAAPSPPRTELEQLVTEHEHLADLRELFLDAFANPPREPEIEFEPTVKAALFLMHDERVLGLLQPRPGNLIDRLSKMDDNRQTAEQLFLAVFSRRPNDDERADVEKYVAENKDRRTEALGQLAWAMLASIEFCVNH